MAKGKDSKPVKDCRSCRLRAVCGDSMTSWFFFFVGIVATVAMRVIEPLRTVNPLWGKVSWYVGVWGFVLFFVYKYRVLKGRSRIIKESRLKEKLAHGSRLADEDNGLLLEIVCSEDNWKERVNFLVIFGVSVLALIYAILTDLGTIGL